MYHHAVESVNDAVRATLALLDLRAQIDAEIAMLDALARLTGEDVIGDAYTWPVWTDHERPRLGCGMCREEFWDELPSDDGLDDLIF